MKSMQTSRESHRKNQEILRNQTSKELGHLIREPAKSIRQLQTTKAVHFENFAQYGEHEYSFLSRKSEQNFHLHKIGKYCTFRMWHSQRVPMLAVIKVYNLAILDETCTTHTGRIISRKYEVHIISRTTTIQFAATAKIGNVWK